MTEYRQDTGPFELRIEPGIDEYAATKIELIVKVPRFYFALAPMHPHPVFLDMKEQSKRIQIRRAIDSFADLIRRELEKAMPKED